MDLTDLMNLYRGPLIGLIASWGAPWGEAVDLAQESFATAWLNRASCRGDWTDPAVFGPWLRGVARNHYRNWARSRGRHRARFVTLNSATLGARAVGPAADPSTDEAELIRRAIERLPAPQRQVIWMHYLEESTVIEVATLLGITSKAVEGRLYQARRNLRRLLDDPRPASKIGGLFLWL